jgi:tetratricopeptide (TPR) repeat protein
MRIPRLAAIVALASSVAILPIASALASYCMFQGHVLHEGLCTCQDYGTCGNNGSGRVYREPRAPTEEEQAADAYDAGRQALKRGDYADAVRLLNRAVRLDAKQEYLDWLTVAAFRAQDWRVAWDAADALTRTAPDFGRGWYLKAEILTHNDFYKQFVSEKRYEDLLTQLLDAEGFLEKALELGMSGDNTKAAQELLAFVRKQRDAVAPRAAAAADRHARYMAADAANEDGVKLFNSGDIEGALRQFEKAKDLFPSEKQFAGNVEMAHRRLAHDYYKAGADAFHKGDYDSALQEFERAQKHSPSNKNIADAIATTKARRDQHVIESDAPLAQRKLEQEAPQIENLNARYSSAWSQATATQQSSAAAAVEPNLRRAKEESNCGFDTTGGCPKSAATLAFKKTNSDPPALAALKNMIPPAAWSDPKIGESVKAFAKLEAQRLAKQAEIAKIQQQVNSGSSTPELLLKKQALEGEVKRLKQSEDGTKAVIERQLKDDSLEWNEDPAPGGTADAGFK